jgi:hypothetical protein
MSLTKATYSMIDGAVVNILDYGATANYDETTPGSGTDNSAAIQAAVDAVAAKGVYNKGAVFIPSGAYKILNTIDVPYGVSIFGEGGTASVLHAEDCDGLNFVSYGYQIGSMFYEDFGLTAATGANRVGVLTDTNPSTMDGLYFNRLRFYGWNQCFVLRANWDCTISECVGQNINQGIEVASGSGQAIALRILNNRFTKAAGGLGSAPTYAINLDGSSAFTESVIISFNKIFGFDRNVNVGKGYFVNIISNDFSGSERVISFVDSAGGYNITDNFIEVTSNGTGLFAPSLGSSALEIRSSIQNNHFVGTGVGSPAYGIDLGQGGGSFQWDVDISNNTFTGFFNSDIRIVAGGITTITTNNCISSAPTHSIFLDTVTGPPIVIENNYCAKALTINNAVDYTSGKVILANNIENGTFQSNKQSAPPSTGTWRVTDIVWNSAPASGQPAGWVCTVAGTPGTWVAMANLA